jgi:hypothetical protein
MTGMSLASPVPGTLQGNMVTPSPTTLSAAAGQVQPGKSKTPFVIAAALTLVLAAGGVFMLLNKNKDSEVAAKPDDGSAKVAVNKQTQPPPPPPDTGSNKAMGTPDNKGSATPDNKGSATPPDNKGSAMTVEKGSAEPKQPKDVLSFSAVTITSTPSGAEILINGASLGKKTPATLNLPMGKDVSVRLKLSGFADFKKDLSINKETIEFAAPLRKVASSGTGKGSGKGNGGQKNCDTCLERPD